MRAVFNLHGVVLVRLHCGGNLRRNGIGAHILGRRTIAPAGNRTEHRSLVLVGNGAGYRCIVGMLFLGYLIAVRRFDAGQGNRYLSRGNGERGIDVEHKLVIAVGGPGTLQGVGANIFTGFTRYLDVERLCDSRCFIRRVLNGCIAACIVNLVSVLIRVSLAIYLGRRFNAYQRLARSHIVHTMRAIFAGALDIYRVVLIGLHTIRHGGVNLVHTAIRCALAAFAGNGALDGIQVGIRNGAFSHYLASKIAVVRFVAVDGFHIRQGNGNACGGNGELAREGNLVVPVRARANQVVFTHVFRMPTA